MGREYMDSLELYNNYQNSRLAATEQEIIYELTIAILREFQTKGFASYIDSLRGRRLDYIEQAAISAVYAYYKEGKTPQYKGERAITIPEPFSRAFSRMINNSVLNKDQSNLFLVLRTITKYGREQHLEYIEGLIQSNRELEIARQKASGQFDREAIIQRAKKEAYEIVDMAREDARQVRENALGEAEEIKGSVRQEIASMRSEAAEANEREREEAENYVLQMKRQAEEEASRIKQDANTGAEDIRRDAMEEMEAEKEELKRNSEKIAQKLIDKNIRQYQAESRREIMDEVNQYYQKGEESAREIKQLHVEMCDVTNGLQAAWTKVLEDTFEKMSELRSDFYQKLGDWQKALYPSSYQALAERYVELYSVLNIDKTIRTIILEENKKTAQINPEQQEEEFEMPVSDTVKALQKLDSNLKVSLKKLENTLNGFGLYVFYPEKGEEYNEVLHSSYEEETDGDLVVEECIVPGVMMKRMRGFEDEVVKQALVSLREKEPENIDFEG